MTSQVMTAEQVRNSRQAAAAPKTVEVGLTSLEGFELAQRIAKMLAASTMVPEVYRDTLKIKDGKDQNGNWLYRSEPNPNGLANCVIALNMANRMGADPLMIMQNLYIVEGRPAWSSQFVIGAINTSGKYSPLRFEMEDHGEVEVTYTTKEWKWNERVRKNLPEEKVHTVKLRNITCKAWAIEAATGERLESAEISMEMAVKEGWYQKNGSKWQTMPEQMLRYRAASFFGRIYAPEVLMGIRTQEEELDAIIDVTPEPAPQSAPVTTSDLKANVVKDVPAEQQQVQEEEKKPRTRKQPKVEPGNVQNSTEKEVPAEADPVKSAEVKKHYSLALTEAKTNEAIEKLKAQFEEDNNLIDTHKSYLNEYVNIRLRAIETAAQQEKKQPVVDKIKSSSTRAGIERMIADAQDVYALETQVVQTIKGHKDKMTAEDHQEVLTAYAQRKEVLSQQDIFSNAVSLVDSYLQSIEQAQNIDRLAEIMSDPTVNSMPDADTARINAAYDRRYAELSE